MVQRSIRNLTAKDILDWAKDDVTSKEDHFDFIPKAEKIAACLTNSINAKENNAKRNVTIGSRGKYGSGKSTIMKLVKSIVIRKHKQQDIIFIQANCWGFDDAQSVQEYIIRKIIDGMTEAGLDTDHLVGIPKQYVRALAGAHAFFGLFANMFNNESVPEKILKRIDDALYLVCGR